MRVGRAALRETRLQSRVRLDHVLEKSAHAFEVAVTASGLRPGEGQSAAAFWIGAVVGVSNGAAEPGTRVDPTPLFVGGP